MKKILFTLGLGILCVSASFAQENSPKVNVYLSYSQVYGFKEKNVFWNLNGFDDGLKTNSFHVKGMYRINMLISCGIGFGLDESSHRTISLLPGYDLSFKTHSSFPVYASVHFYPMRGLDGFLYSNLGYSLDTKISYPGVFYEAGIGYQWLFRRHFGLFLTAGYNFKQLRNVRMHEFLGESNVKLTHTTRQSLSLSFGFIF